MIIKTRVERIINWADGGEVERWFAWRPVWVEPKPYKTDSHGYWVWLQFIRRQRVAEISYRERPNRLGGTKKVRVARKQYNYWRSDE